MSEYSKALELYYSTERSLTKQEILLLLEHSKSAADILVSMGLVFKTAFLEANRIYLAMYDIAKARHYLA